MEEDRLVSRLCICRYGIYTSASPVVAWWLLKTGLWNAWLLRISVGSFSFGQVSDG